MKKSINNFPDEILANIQEYHTMSDLQAHSCVNKNFSSFFKPFIEERRSLQVIRQVTLGNQKAIEELSPRDVSLVLYKGSITDPAGRNFNCSAFQYALWAHDISIAKVMIELSSAREDILKQFLEQFLKVKNEGLTYTLNNQTYTSSQYDYSSINLMFNYLKVALTNYAFPVAQNPDEWSPIDNDMFRNYNTMRHTENWGGKIIAFINICLSQHLMPTCLIQEILNRRDEPNAFSPNRDLAIYMHTEQVDHLNKWLASYGEIPIISQSIRWLQNLFETEIEAETPFDCRTLAIDNEEGVWKFDWYTLMKKLPYIPVVVGSNRSFIRDYAMTGDIERVMDFLCETRWTKREQLNEIESRLTIQASPALTF